MNRSSDTFSLISTRSLSESLPVFRDHFPQTPIYPAFLQLGWVREELESPNARFERVKFKKPALPGETLNLYVRKSVGRSLEFESLIQAE